MSGKEVAGVALFFILLGSLAWGAFNVTHGGPSVEPTKALADSIPEATGHVVDNADIISAEVQEILEAELQAFDPEVAVLTVKSLNGMSIEQFGIKVAEKWLVGSAQHDDGVILIVSTGDREARIEVGYGAEGSINDAKAGRILDESVIPYFRNGNWEGGILNGVSAIKAALK